jgi:DNA-binding XRE family transcriptional regulator
MTPKPLDFTKVEALRKHMLLTTANMAELLGVSRMTYYGWVRGKPLRKSNDETVRIMLKRLLAVVTKYGWPMPEVIAASQKQRKQRLLELLNQ